MVMKKKQDLSRYDKKENKQKRPAIDNHSDCENAVVKKKKGKKKEKDNTIVEYNFTAKWRKSVKKIVNKKSNTINISKLDNTAIIYINSTVFETVKVEKTVQLSRLNVVCPSYEIRCVVDYAEMKDILRQNLVKCNKLMVDTNYKLKIALSFNPEDKELKKMIEERNNVFLDFFKVEDNNENLEGEEIDGDKNRNTNENPLEKGHNEEIGSEEVEGIKINVKKTKGMKNNRKHVENQMKMKVIMKQTIMNLRALTILETYMCSSKGKWRIKISEPLSEEEKKLVEYIWSDSCPESDIVFARKRLELECLWFLSLYPEIKVDATVIDAWSDVLNHEEKYRRNLLITSHVYCWTEMLPPYLVEDKNQVNERRRIFNENVAMILENSKKKNFNHVDLVSFFPCIKDSNHHYIICFDMKNAEIDIISNINNDVEDISERYGDYAISMIDSFINYLERHNHPSIFAIVNANPKQVPMTWKTSNNCVDSRVFVMRHMETYLGSEEFCQEDAVEKNQLYILRAKSIHLAFILLSYSKRFKHPNWRNCTEVFSMAPNSPMPVVRGVVDELIGFSKETEPLRYMNFFMLQQISEGLCFFKRMRDEAQSSRSCLAQLNAMISELEAMNDAGELFDTLMCLRDDKRVESDNLLLLNEMIAIVEEDIANKEAHVSSG
ncbi:hypothetical protein Tco_0846938 [Tanacetum coccineum]